MITHLTVDFPSSLSIEFQQEGLEGEVTRRSLTYSSWDLSSSKDHERRGWHPVTYKFSDATPMLIQTIKVLLPWFCKPFFDKFLILVDLIPCICLKAVFCIG